MKELTDEQKTSIWTRLGSALGLSEAKVEQLAVAPEAPETPADEAAETPEEEVQEEQDQTAINQDLQKQIDELKAAHEAIMAGNATLTATNTELKTKLAAIEAKPADKKVTLSNQSNPVAKTKGQIALEHARALRS